jgi:hypothetical protein
VTGKWMLYNWSQQTNRQPFLWNCDKRWWSYNF